MPSVMKSFRVRFLIAAFVIGLVAVSGAQAGVQDLVGTLEKISILNIGNNPICGRLPGSLGLLSQLARLDARGTQLSGILPSLTGSRLSLKKLQLGGGNFSGPVLTHTYTHIWHTCRTRTYSHSYKCTHLDCSRHVGSDSGS